MPINNSKKAQSLSLNTIIVIVLCLLVLIIGIYLLYDVFFPANKMISCPSKGCVCMSSCNDVYSKEIISLKTSCPSGDICCKLS